MSTRAVDHRNNVARVLEGTTTKIEMGRAVPGAVIAGNEDAAKSSWPEVVGWVLLNAADQINIDRPDVSVAFYMIPTPLPTDHDPKRVIIVGDNRDVVARTPVVG